MESARGDAAAVLTPPPADRRCRTSRTGAWHEYGNRVGFWRMLEVLDRARIRAAVAINGGARISDLLTQRIELSTALSAARSRPAGAQALLPPKV
jgi:hypothetical protein